jgi:hypothetical protein
MEDPFLYEAIEGFDRVDDNHLNRIKHIRKNLFLQIPVSIPPAPVISRSDSKTEVITHTDLPPEDFSTPPIADSVPQEHHLSIRSEQPLETPIADSVHQEQVPSWSFRSELRKARHVSLWDVTIIVLVIAILSAFFIHLTKKTTPEEETTFVLPPEIQSPTEEILFKEISLRPKEKNELPERKEEKPSNSKYSGANPILLTSSDLNSIEDKFVSREKNPRGSKGNVTLAIQQNKPVPMTGENAYRSYLERNIRRPSVGGDCADARGKVILIFKVNERGRPYNITVFRSLCQGADREAIRLLSEGPDWTKGDKEVRLEISF